MTEPRPHRAALSPDEAAATLGREASAGRLDVTAVAAVLEAAGQPVPRMERPAGLTEREAEVIGLLARGLQTKQVARALGISAKTDRPPHPERLRARSASRRAPRRRCSPWSTGSPRGENSRLAARTAARSVAPGNTARAERSAR